MEGIGNGADGKIGRWGRVKADGRGGDGEGGNGNIGERSVI